LLREGKVAGLFQVEGEGFREFLLHLQPTEFSDVYAALALYRPGTLNSGGADTYIKRKHGLEPVDYFGVPELEPILKETYGVIVYQEQVMQIASVVAGYSLSEADLLRRAIGKKDKQRADFINRAKNRQIAERIYDVQERAEHGPYSSLQDLQKRAKPDKSTLTSLIRSGALESIGVPRNGISQLPSEIEAILDSIYNNVIPPHIIRYPLGENEYLLQRIIRTDDNSIFVLVDANGNTYDVEIEDRDWLQELLQSSRRLYETALESDLNERINGRTFGALMDNIVIKGTLVPIGASRYTLKPP